MAGTPDAKGPMDDDNPNPYGAIPCHICGAPFEPGDRATSIKVAQGTYRLAHAHCVHRAEEAL